MMNWIRQFLWLGAVGFAWSVIAAEPVAYWRFDEGDANSVCAGAGARIVSGHGRGKSLRLDSPRARASAKAADGVPDISATERPFTAMIRVRPDVDVVSDTMASMAKICNSRFTTVYPKDPGTKLTLPLVAKKSKITFGGSISWGFYSLAYKGLIDDVVLFSMPLSSEEISASIK